MDVTVVGAGIFGVTAALELRDRGHRVTLLDQGTIPHPDAASTDISKVIRMEYGPDEDYMALVERAMPGWDAWNERWQDEGLGRLYHETGVLMVSRAEMAPGGFEYEGWATLNKRGHSPERLNAAQIAARFPAWSTGNHVDGFYHGRGGYAESSRVVEALVRWASRAGVEIVEQEGVTGLVSEGSRVVGVETTSGRSISSDMVVLTTGAWIGQLVPELAKLIRPTGHPVFHFRASDPDRFAPGVFPVFTADIARTGFYGFPANRQGVVKIAIHGSGTETDPTGPRKVAKSSEKRMRGFLGETFPDLVDAPIVETRLCLYADSLDGNCWISQDPERPGLAVASGGSGHGFKFAPLLGGLIADAVEGASNPALLRFGWRPDVAADREAARYQD